MAVRLESTIKRFIGKSTDAKPTTVSQGADKQGEITPTTNRDMPAGSTFFEEDSGNIWRWNGIEWVLPAATENIQRHILEELFGIHRELVSTRLGMIEAGECRDVSKYDVERELMVS